MKNIIVAIALIATASVNAARWTQETLVKEDTLKSVALKQLVEDFKKSNDELGLDVGLDMYATTAKIIFKKDEEPLRNSIKQLHHINASDWYCYVQVETDRDMFKMTRKNAKNATKTLYYVLEDLNVLHNEWALENFEKRLYNVAKPNKLPAVLSSIYCEDEYAWSQVLSVYDEKTRELVNLKVGYSE